ncbi:MAG: AMP-binding protein [Porticoccaceae bacterium]|nr:AMP-binding protein [Porticoccaceae bacterium]
MKTNASRHANLNAFFAERTATFGEKPALTCLGHSLSYRELDRHATDFAGFLQNSLGLAPGDRIAIQLPNLLQYPVIVMAAMKVGLVVVNTNPLYTRRELDHQFSDAGVRAVVVLADLASNVAAVQDDTGVEHVIITEVGDLHPPFKRFAINAVMKLRRLPKPMARPRNVVSFHDALARGRAAPPREVARQPEDLALLQYTGGTTGVAKGAMLSHRNLLANIQQVEDSLGQVLVEGEEILVAPLPIYHIFAFMLCMLLGVGIGARVILIPDPRNLNAFVRELKGLRFTFFAGLNTLFNALCRHPGFNRLDFSRLRITVSGGMALTRDTAERWERVTGCRIIEGYGLTEASPVVAINPVEAPKLGTVGKLLADTELKLLDANGAEVAQGQPGELWVRGPQVMSGYWQRPDATREMLDENGWLHTGDVAVMDGEGYLSIVDRIKDMIVVSGFNVYPNELEDEISKHPDVVECAAVGIADPETVEAVKLFVVTSNPALTAEDIRHFARQNLTGYKVPKHVEFIKELPKSNVGKVLRRELRK